LKPENILYSEDDGRVKIADFGLAKELDPSQTMQTSYVSTRWYRAPEICLKCCQYDQKIDIFAVGCILVELITGKPLLPSKSELDQIAKLTALIGKPNESWTQG